MFWEQKYKILGYSPVQIQLENASAYVYLSSFKSKVVNDCPSDKLLSPDVMLESKRVLLFLDKCLKSLRYLE